MHQATLEHAFGRIFAVVALAIVLYFWGSAATMRGQQPGSLAANLLLSMLLIGQAVRASRRAPSQRDYSQGSTDPASVSCTSASGSGWSAPVNADADGPGLGSLGAAAPVVSCPTSTFCALVDGGGGNVITFDGSSWGAPLTIFSDATASDSGPFLLSASCPSAAFCVAGDPVGDAFIRS